jgi:hypothetical protein
MHYLPVHPTLYVSISSVIIKDSILEMYLGILSIPFLPSILYCIIAMIAKEMESIIIPALFLLVAE